MRSVRSIASVAVAATVLAGLGVLAATPASAADRGPLLPGNLYFLTGNTPGFAAAGPENQVTSGTYAPAPFLQYVLAADQPCPAGTATVNAFVRQATTGPEVTWEEWAFAGQKVVGTDAAGNSYLTGPFNSPKAAQIQQFLAANPSVTQLPLALVCYTSGGTALGRFETQIHLDANTTNDGTWALIDPAIIEAPKTPTTTTLGSVPTSVEQGTAVSLSATVDPSAATGDIEYLDGATSLGISAIGTPLVVTTLGVGSHSITAKYLGSTSYEESTSAAASIEVTPVAPRSTETELVVSPLSGAAYQSVTLTATVTASTGLANGTVTFKDGALTLGSVPSVNGVVPAFTTNQLGAGAHSLTAEFTGTAPYQNSVSETVEVLYELVGGADEQTVVVTIPAGAITITTPYTPESPLNLGTAVLDTSDSTYSASAPFEDIVITDTRAGNLGFTASVVSGPFSSGTDSFGGDYAGLTGLVATQVAGNALDAGDLSLTDHAPFSDGLGTAKVFAVYPAGLSIGTTQIDGVFGIDQVPTSVTPGLYTATVTFTAV